MSIFCWSYYGSAGSYPFCWTIGFCWSYYGSANRIAYLGRERGSEDFTDILSYLDHSPLSSSSIPADNVPADSSSSVPADYVSA
ncbi:hypothetical protein Tco_0293524, partial [Tanacetum coccineum]